MEIMKKKETEHIIAMLDMLGAKEIIGTEKSEDALNWIYRLYQRSEEVWPKVDNAPQCLKKIKCIKFSDNIAFSMEIPDDLAKENRDEMIDSFVQYIGIVQGVAFAEGWLFRGGITIGKLFAETANNIIWGRALVDAHILEEKVAIYPRIVLSKELGEMNSFYRAKVCMDYDGIFFVDYVSMIIKKTPEKLCYGVHKVKKEIQRMQGNERVIQKLEWVLGFIDRCKKETLD